MTISAAPGDEPNDKDPKLPVTKSEAAESSSANSRINIPLNLENWKDLPPHVSDQLLWFHQHALDTGMQWEECAEALDYDRSTVFKVLKGQYGGSWEKVAQSIRSYRKIVADRGTIQKNEFVHNSITKLIFSGLSYAMANNSITMIIGESRMGKTTAAKQWRDENNHGRSVFITAPAFGGTKGMLRDIAQAVGVGRNSSVPQMHESILRAFNQNRILIVDEAHRLMPGDARSIPVNLEILRDIHDRTGAALALMATARFDSQLRKGEYQFEQLLGRIGMPIRLPRAIRKSDIAPLIEQYVKKPSAVLIEACHGIANQLGRLGILVETLKVASRMAAKQKLPLTEEIVLSAIKLRQQMMGEQTYAEK
ncbi:MAG: AAA family ATPase [Verrucomicrobiota bacterium]|nr:AAA family ATPase [Verrucomicrobiota bacterium]